MSAAGISLLFAGRRHLAAAAPPAPRNRLELGCATSATSIPISITGVNRQGLANRRTPWLDRGLAHVGARGNTVHPPCSTSPATAGAPALVALNDNWTAALDSAATERGLRYGAYSDWSDPVRRALGSSRRGSEVRWSTTGRQRRGTMD